MPKTIVHVVSTLDRCGPVNVLRGIVEHLDAERYRAVVATLSPEGGNSCIDEFRAMSIPVKPLNLSRAGSFAFGRQRLARLAGEVNADAVHAHGIRATVLAAGIKAQYTVVSTLHCDLIGDYRLAYGRVAGRLMAAREYSALKRFDGVAAVSQSVAGAALKAGIEARVIPNGIDLNLFLPPKDTEEIRSLRRKFGWPEDAVIVLHTGALIGRKNPQGAIAGFQGSTLAHTGLLAFAGDGPMRAACERLAAASSNIVFLGKRTDIPDLLKAADFLLSNSSAEGLPMALLEGCAAGIHVVATAIAPHEDIRRIFPEQVTLFNEGTPEAISETLDKLVAAKAGRVFSPPEESLESVSGRVMSRHYQAFYDELLAAQAKRVPLRGSQGGAQPSVNAELSPEFPKSSDNPTTPGVEMLLSVLMPVYHKESPVHLRQSLDSLAAQTVPADEVVIVEDGPLGEPLDAIIAAYKKNLSIVSLRLPVHVGLGAALRAGLYICRGEYVARMDADDICVPDRFERQMNFLECNREVDVVGSAIAEFEQDCSAPRAIRLLPAAGPALLRFAKSRTPMNHVTVVFRKASVVAAGNYESCHGFEDYHLWARMLTLGYRLHNMKDILVYARCGNGMQGRRGGLAYLKGEIEFQSFLRKMGLLDASGSIWNILMRGPIRLAPDSVRSLCYSLFLRTSPTTVQRIPQ